MGERTDGKLRIGVIGCGAGIFHLEGYRAEPRATVVALAGLDTDRCRSLARQFEIPQTFGDYQDLLAVRDIDAVSIAVPNHLHMPVVIAALEAGKHVLIEKPLARTAGEGEQMVAAARKAERVLAVAFNRRYRDDMMLVHDHVANGGFGRIYHAAAFWMRRAGIPGLGTWFTSKEHAGGGPLIDLGVHVLDMALYAMGNPTVTTVSAATYAEIGPQGKGNFRSSKKISRAPGTGGYEVEDFATAFLRMDDGATLTLKVAWAAYTSAEDDFGITLMGSKGGCEIYSRNYALTGTLKVFGDFEGVASDSEPRLIERNGHAEVIHRFVDSIVDGAPVTPSGEEGVDRARLVDAIYQSAAEGKEIAVGRIKTPAL
ncbi:MAG: Gfo/Idh/MocA family protein [Thermomicrobiales bacterium]